MTQKLLNDKEERVPSSPVSTVLLSSSPNKPESFYEGRSGEPKSATMLSRFCRCHPPVAWGSLNFYLMPIKIDVLPIMCACTHTHRNSQASVGWSHRPHNIHHRQRQSTLSSTEVKMPSAAPAEVSHPLTVWGLFTTGPSFTAHE